MSIDKENDEENINYFSVSDCSQSLELSKTLSINSIRISHLKPTESQVLLTIPSEIPDNQTTEKKHTKTLSIEIDPKESIVFNKKEPKLEISNRSIFYTPSTICNYYDKSNDATPNKVDKRGVHKFKLNFRNLNLININNNSNTSRTFSNYEENVTENNEANSGSYRNVNTFDKRSPIKYTKMQMSSLDKNKISPNTSTSPYVRVFEGDTSSVSIVKKNLNVSELEIKENLNFVFQNVKTLLHKEDSQDTKPVNIVNINVIKNENFSFDMSKVTHNFANNFTIENKDKVSNEEKSKYFIHPYQQKLMRNKSVSPPKLSFMKKKEHLGSFVLPNNCSDFKNMQEKKKSINFLFTPKDRKIDCKCNRFEVLSTGITHPSTTKSKASSKDRLFNTIRTTENYRDYDPKSKTKRDTESFNLKKSPSVSHKTPIITKENCKIPLRPKSASRKSEKQISLEETIKKILKNQFKKSDMLHSLLPKASKKSVEKTSANKDAMTVKTKRINILKVDKENISPNKTRNQSINKKPGNNSFHNKNQINLTTPKLNIITNFSNYQKKTIISNDKTEDKKILNTDKCPVNKIKTVLIKMKK